MNTYGKLSFQLLFIGLIALTGCTHKAENKESSDNDSHPLFTLLTPEQTHVDFNNTLTEGLNTNVLMYEAYKSGFIFGDMGRAMAIIVVVVLLLLVIVGLQFKLLSSRAEAAA